MRNSRTRNACKPTFSTRRVPFGRGVSSAGVIVSFEYTRHWRSTEGTGSQEERSNEDERSFSHRGHEDHDAVGRFDWPPKGGLPRCTGTQLQTALAPSAGL